MKTWFHQPDPERGAALDLPSSALGGHARRTASVSVLSYPAMQPSPAARKAELAPLPLPDDAGARDAKYQELAALLDVWMKEEHGGEPEWDVDDLVPVRLRVPTGVP